MQEHDQEDHIRLTTKDWGSGRRFELTATIATIKGQPSERQSGVEDWTRCVRVCFFWR